MTALFKYADVDGDRVAVFDADIPGKGKGVNIKTDHDGCSIPVAEIPQLIEVLLEYTTATLSNDLKPCGHAVDNSCECAPEEEPTS